MRIGTSLMHTGHFAKPSAMAPSASLTSATHELQTRVLIFASLCAAIRAAPYGLHALQASLRSS
jgi:hypothetical protein